MSCLDEQECRDALRRLPFYGNEEDAKAFNLLEELIDEHFRTAHPKPPTEKTRMYMFREYKCPNCGVYVHKENRCCGFCGQVLDWSKQIDEEREDDQGRM